ncbi:MAG: phosphoglucosamine mutase [Thermoproteota archaeon]|nr:phosphoglucosamine mutase [Thermoproteota archaeon]
MSSKRLFGTNGIRGVVNQDLTPEFVMKIAGAVGTFFNGGHVMVGYDGRVSGPMLAETVFGGLSSTGCTVYNVGMAPTPAVQYAVKQHNVDGGIVITASHNPAEYNGIKVIGKNGVELPREKEIEIEKIFFEDKTQLVEWNEIGRVQQLPEILYDYKEAVKQHVDVEAIRRKKLHVAVDPANGVGALVAPYLLQELGCRVTTINADVDGSFPSRPPEPRPENLHDLASTVMAVNADVGVAYDGDADRAIFVDEKGEIHWGDRSFALIEKHFLEAHPGETIVTPVSSSRVVKDVAENYESQVVWTRVGSIIVSHKMLSLNAKLGGEENGGVFYAPHQPVRDGAMATALILDVMAKTDRKLSELLAELPSYCIEKHTFGCPNRLKQKVLEKFMEETKNLEVDATDGAKIWFPDNNSILIRPSGTEPVFRFYAEAKSKKRACKLINTYKAKLQEIVSMVKKERST